MANSFEFLVSSHDTVDTSGVSDLLECVNQEAARKKRLSPEVTLWAQQELTAAQAPWDAYGEDGKQATQSFLAGANSLKKLTDFHDACARIAGATVYNFEGVKDVLRTSNGTPISQTMHLVYVPWKQLYDTITGNGPIPDKWLAHMRTQQTRAVEEYGYGVLMDQLRAGSVLYRVPRRAKSKDAPGWTDAKGYLERRMAEDGEWGAVLAQNTDDAGVIGPDWQMSFDQPSGEPLRTSKAVSELRGLGIHDFDVTGLGVFEMTAIMLAHQGTPPTMVLPTYRVQDQQVFSMTELLPANLNPVTLTVPKVRAQDRVIHWGTHHGESELAVDAHMRLCMV